MEATEVSAAVFGKDGLYWRATPAQRSVLALLFLPAGDRSGGERALADRAGVGRQVVRSTLALVKAAGLQPLPVEAPPPAPAAPPRPAQPLLIEAAPQPRPPKVPPARPDSPLSFFLASNIPEIKDPVGFEAKLRKAFPGVDLLGEVRKAWMWNQAQRAGAQKKDMAKFIVNWCGRAGQGSGASSAAPTRGVITGFDSEGRAIYGGKA